MSLEVNKYDFIIRVADASIFPTIPSGNTNAACIMVGEKVSELIKESINRGE